MLRAFTFDRLLLTLFCLAITVACGLTRIQTDTWWQLRAGKDMWASRSVLLTDVYSHTSFGQPWPNHEWLSEVIFYGLYKVGGFPLLTLSAAALILGGWLVSWSMAQGGARWRFAWMILALLPASMWWEPRPHAFSLLFIPTTVLLLSSGRWAWLVPVFFVWANCHGGVLLGFVLLAAGLGTQVLLNPSKLWRALVVTRLLRPRRDGHAARHLFLDRDPGVAGADSPLPARRMAASETAGHQGPAVLAPGGGLLLWPGPDACHVAAHAT